MLRTSVCSRHTCPFHFCTDLALPCQGCMKLSLLQSLWLSDPNVASSLWPFINMVQYCKLKIHVLGRSKYSPCYCKISPQLLLRQKSAGGGLCDWPLQPPHLVQAAASRQLVRRVFMTPRSEQLGSENMKTAQYIDVRWQPYLLSDRDLPSLTKGLTENFDNVFQSKPVKISVDEKCVLSDVLNQICL